MTSTKEALPIDHNRIKELICHEKEDPNGWDDVFHENAVPIIEQLLSELVEVTLQAPQITDESAPLSDKERDTVLQEKWYVLGPHAKHHHNWIKRMEATVRNRDEVILQLKDKCPDCDSGWVTGAGGYRSGCMTCDGSGRLIVSQMLASLEATNKSLRMEAKDRGRRLIRIEQGFKEIGMKVIDNGTSVVVQLCPPQPKE